MRQSPPIPRGWRLWSIGFLFWTVVGLLMFGYQYLDVVVREGSDPFYETLIEELTGAYATGVLAIGIARLVHFIRLHRLRWVRAVLFHTVAAPIYSAIHTTILWGSRIAVWQIFQLGTYDYGRMPVRYFMEMGNDLLDYFILASLLHLILHHRASFRREIEVAQLERELTRAKLQALEAQLRPHFLFNALNTVSSVMYRDVAAADRVLARLGDLLRSSLKSEETHETTLAEEMETLELYLDIMRARFGDRLSVDVQIEAHIQRARVPRLLLQPLVENALEHGDPGSDHPAHIEIRAERHTDHALRLTVHDNGNGTPRGNVTFGVGLRNTTARLEHLYPDVHRFSASNDERGFKVEIILPLLT